MRSQKRLRDELQFVTEFNTLFDVVQQVAVSQLRRAEEVAAGVACVADVLAREYFPMLPRSADRLPLLRGRVDGPRLIVMITSDEGLVGPLHTAVAREAQRRAAADTRWLFIGQRGLRLLGNAATKTHVVPIPIEERMIEQMRRVTEYLLTQYTQGALKDVWMVAPRFLSATRQEVVTYRLLPLPVLERSSADVAEDNGLVIEPSVERVVGRLARLWVEAVCVEAFWSARRAEFAARAMHVEVSRQELAKRSRVVRLEFFKTMHERVDVLVRETCVVQRHLTRRAKGQDMSQSKVLHAEVMS